MLQSAKPALQVPVQLPAVQDALMLEVEQPWKQPPQCDGSVAVPISQPSTRRLLLQLAKVGEQAPVQDPAEQPPPTTFVCEQTALQPPQWTTEPAWMFCSQPSLGALLQSAVP